MATPTQLRHKIYDALDRGESAESIAHRFEIGRRTVDRLRQRRQAGLQIQPDKPGPKLHTKLTDQDLQTIRDAVTQKPDIMLREIQPMLSVKVNESTICRALQKMNLTLKKRR